MLGKVGDKVRDCDPRSSHRTGVIAEVFPNGYAIRWWNGRTTMCLAHRLHDKPNRSGVRIERDGA